MDLRKNMFIVLFSRHENLFLKKVILYLILHENLWNWQNLHSHIFNCGIFKFWINWRKQNKQWWHCREWQIIGLPVFLYLPMYFLVKLFSPPNFCFLFFRAIGFMRCFWFNSYWILSLMVDNIKNDEKMASKSKQN